MEEEIPPRRPSWGMSNWGLPQSGDYLAEVIGRGLPAQVFRGMAGRGLLGGGSLLAFWSPRNRFFEGIKVNKSIRTDRMRFWASFGVRRRGSVLPGLLSWALAAVKPPLHPVPLSRGTLLPNAPSESRRPTPRRRMSCFPPASSE